MHNELCNEYIVDTVYFYICTRMVSVDCYVIGNGSLHWTYFYGRFNNVL